jgi:hypothetical protein
MRAVLLDLLAQTVVFFHMIVVKQEHLDQGGEPALFPGNLKGLQNHITQLLSGIGTANPGSIVIRLNGKGCSGIIQRYIGYVIHEIQLGGRLGTNDHDLANGCLNGYDRTHGIAVEIRDILREFYAIGVLLGALFLILLNCHEIVD